MLLAQLIRLQIAAFYYPNPPEAEGQESGSSEGHAEGGEATSTAEMAAKATEHATEAALRFFRG